MKGSGGLLNLSVENFGGRGFLKTGGHSHFPHFTTQGFYFKYSKAGFLFKCKSSYDSKIFGCLISLLSESESKEISSFEKFFIFILSS